MPKPTPLTWFYILAVLAIALALGLPPDPKHLAELHTDSFSYRLAVASILVPYALIWFAGFYAFEKLQQYSKPLKGTKDGDAFRKITRGMGALAFSLVVPTIISLILKAIVVHNRDFEIPSIIITHYLALVPGLVSFFLLYNGARALLNTVNGRVRRPDIRWHAAWFLLLSVVFTHIAIQNHFQANPYHMPLVVLMVTIIVPYLYGWVVGLLCAYDLYVYGDMVKGVLYRRAMKQFAAGILIAIIASIAIQFINTTLLQQIKDSLGAILIFNYCLLAVIATGLVLIALGTKKLKLMEEV